MVLKFLDSNCLISIEYVYVGWIYVNRCLLYIERDRNVCDNCVGIHLILMYKEEIKCNKLRY